MHPILDLDYRLADVIELPRIAPLPPIRSERAATVARWFGIEDRVERSARVHADARQDNPRQADAARLRRLLPRAGEITLLAGASGAGKSSLLRELCSIKSRATRVDLNQIQLSAVPLVDCFAGLPLDQTLALLSHVGLAEAWSYLRTPDELSEGQRWRLRLALAMRHGAGENGAPSSGAGKSGANRRPRLMIVADEFAAMLDRVTAAIVARCLRRSISATENRCAIIATSHDDLIRALAPETIIQCDFRLIEVRRRIGRRGDGGRTTAPANAATALAARR